MEYYESLGLPVVVLIGSRDVAQSLRFGPRTITLPRGVMVIHVTTHGMHHRAQGLNMLRHIGVTPLPPSSVTEWAWLGDGR